MPNVVVQTSSAGEASDVELPSAASTLTVSAEPSSGPTVMVVENYASPKFRYYILLVNAAIMTTEAERRIVVFFDRKRERPGASFDG